MRLPLPFRLPALRATLLPLLHRTGILKRLMLKAEMPLRHGTTRVELAV
jgi:hypothetical protein